MADDDRTVVKTYVPRSQKEAWVDHAESLDMSQSEFLRTMVQAGRRGFDPSPTEGDSPGTTPGGQGLEGRVLSALSEAGVLGWDELVARLSEDVERELDETLGTLQDDQRVRYSGPHDGYVVVGEEPRANEPRQHESTPNRRRTDDRDELSGQSSRERPPTDRDRERPPDQQVGRRRGGRRPTDERPRSEPRREEAHVDDRQRPTPRAERPRRARGRDSNRRPTARRDERRNEPSTRRPRDDGRSRPRRDERERPPIDSLREARESLDATDESQWDDRRESGEHDRSPTDEVRDDERYDERSEERYDEH